MSRREDETASHRSGEAAHVHTPLTIIVALRTNGTSIHAQHSCTLSAVVHSVASVGLFVYVCLCSTKKNGLRYHLTRKSAET